MVGNPEGLLFGTYLALHGDTLAVGVHLYNQRRGLVYIYQRSYVPSFGNETWFLQSLISNQEQDGGDGAPDDLLGGGIALDSNTLAVGATGHDSAGRNAGAVYVYINNDNYNSSNEDNNNSNNNNSGLFAINTWTLQAKLLPDATDEEVREGDGFGRAVDLAGDTLVVGATYEAKDRGAVYVFVRHRRNNNNNTTNSNDNDNTTNSTNSTNDTTTWTREAKLTASNAREKDIFGFSVSLSQDERTIYVGAPLRDSKWDEENPDETQDLDEGSVYVFVKNDDTTTNNNNSTWIEQRSIEANDAAEADQFGYSVAVDGSTLVVGAPGRGSSNEGAVYVIDLNAALQS